jgi:hypothetical protein
MKGLKIIAVLISALVVIFFLIGIINPVFEYGNAIRIDAPRNKVWSLYAYRKEEWVKGFETQTLVNGIALTKNAEYETTIVSGERMVMRERIVKINPGSNILWALDNDVLNSIYRFEFVDDSTSTQVITHYEVKGKNAFMKSILYLSKGYLTSTDAEMLAALKKIAENKN